jgi:hypothetical protein
MLPTTVAPGRRATHLLACRPAVLRRTVFRQWAAGYRAGYSQPASSANRMASTRFRAFNFVTIVVR